MKRAFPHLGRPPAAPSRLLGWLSLAQAQVRNAVELARLGTTAAEIKALRDKRLRAMVQHAYARVPFYRQLFDHHGVDPTSISGYADLPKLPIVRKRQLKAAERASLHSAGAQLWPRIHETTSGSLGQPMELQRNWPEQLWRRRNHDRGLRALGVHRHDRFVSVAISRPHPPLKSALRELARRSGALFPERLDYQLDPHALATLLRAKQPDVLTGYARTMIDLVRRVEAEQLEGIRPRLVIVGGDALTPGMKTTIETRLSTKVVETYGAQEFGLLAWTCQAQGGMHCADDTVALEVVDDDGRPCAPGVRGRIVVTGLELWSAPFIRYDLGDHGCLGPTTCTCGAGFSNLAKVEGRRYDQFHLPGGRLCEAWALIETIEAQWARDVWRTQLEQMSLDHIIMRVELAPGAGRTVLDALADLARAQFGDDVRCEIRVVDAFPPGNKVRLVHSHVASQYADDEPPYDESPQPSAAPRRDPAADP